MSQSKSAQKSKGKSMLLQTTNWQLNIPNILQAVNCKLTIKKSVWLKNCSKTVSSLAIKKAQYQPSCKNSIHTTSVNIIQTTKMSGKPETKGFKEGLNPPELKTNKSRGRKESTQQWQGSSDREESLSDPRWLKWPPTKEKRKTKI